MRKNDAFAITWNDFVGRRAIPVVAGLRTLTSRYGRLWSYCQQEMAGGNRLPAVESMHPSDRVDRLEKFPGR